MSPAVISRLTAEWQGEYERWQKRDLLARRYVYVWADGVFLQARMEDQMPEVRLADAAGACRPWRSRGGKGASTSA
jgi:transposase-like protein